MEDVAEYSPRKRARSEEEQGQEEKSEANKRKEDTDEMAHLNLLVPNLELATGCSPAHLLGGPPSILAQTLTQRLLTLLHTSQLLSMDDLRIWSQRPSPSSTERTATLEEDAVTNEPEIKAFWTLYIDILFISLSGNAFDAAWLSVLAALTNVRLPRSWWDADHESVLSSPIITEAKGLRLYDMPVALTFGVFFGDKERKQGKEREAKEKWILTDPEGFEEGLCRESCTLVVGGEGRIVRVEKNGGGCFFFVGFFFFLGGLILGGGGWGLGEMRALVELAGKRREEWLSVIAEAG